MYAVLIGWLFVLAEAKEKPFIANPETCRGCHPAQVEFWEKTKHASAYLVLFSKNQHFDPECISCHTLGFENSAGFGKIAQPFELTDTRKRPIPFVEKIMGEVFEGDKAGPLDSRTQPERYALLKKRYHEKMKEAWESKAFKREFLGVQCEHCHGNRNGHPNNWRRAKAKITETTCRTCHRPPNAPEFDPKTIPLVSCPKISK